MTPEPPDALPLTDIVGVVTVTTADAGDAMAIVSGDGAAAGACCIVIVALRVDVSSAESKAVTVTAFAPVTSGIFTAVPVYP